MDFFVVVVLHCIWLTNSSVVNYIKYSLNVLYRFFDFQQKDIKQSQFYHRLSDISKSYVSIASHNLIMK